MSLLSLRSLSHIGLAVSAGALVYMPAISATEMDSCISAALANADSNMTIGELRASCASQTGGETMAEPSGHTPTGVETRLALEKAQDANPWVITPHKPNYILPVHYNSNPNGEPYAAAGLADAVEENEVKFQMSFKFPVARNLFDTNADLMFAYTNQSYWQLYADDVSAPFRDTNHEPEVFLSIPNDWEFMGWKNSLITTGFVHQSNGRTVPLSRSWNRIFASAVFEHDNFAFAVKPWYRLPEDEKVDPTLSEGDDNPDIYKYMGYGEMRLVYHNNDHVVTLMERNNLTSDSKGAAELDYSFPLYGKMKGYAQYFYGYGESLIDYNARTNSVGVGIAISDWF